MDAAGPPDGDAPPPSAPPPETAGEGLATRPGRPRIRSLALRTYERAQEVARVSMLPPSKPGREGRLGWTVVLLVHALRRLARRAGYDRIADRAAALAFYTTLSLLPIVAVTFAALRSLGSVEEQRRVVHVVVEHYFPAATEGVVDRLLPLMTGVEVEAAGLLALAALLPVMIALVSQVERALADIFRKPRRRALLRLALYAGLVTIAPMIAVLTVQFAPRWEAPTFDRHIGPILVTTLLLFLAFRFLPGARVRNRGAFAGGITAALLLALVRELFGVYATIAGQTLTVVWGAITFVPLALAWIFLSWLIVLLGAEIAAVVHELTESLAAPDAIALRQPRARWRPRKSKWRVRTSRVTRPTVPAKRTP